jgi:hypothetical protein
MMTHGQVKVHFLPFLTSALDGDEWLSSGSVLFIPEETVTDKYSTGDGTPQSRFGLGDNQKCFCTCWI